MAIWKDALKPPVYALDRALYLSGLRSAQSLTLPHFLGLGPGQTGTTWLYGHLSRHPEVFMADKKEVHYFNSHFQHWSLGYYASLFAGQAGRIRGEITPGYSILTRQRIAFIGRIMPDVKLILTLRNPIDRSWSSLRRVLGKLGKTLDQVDDETLYRFLDLEWRYREDDRLAVRGDYQQDLLEGNYLHSIDNWLAVFPEAQLLVVFFDELKNAPATYLRKVFDHIGAGLEYQVANDDLNTPVNRNPQADFPERFRHYLAEKYATEITGIARRYGGPSQQWLEALA